MILRRSRGFRRHWPHRFIARRISQTCQLEGFTTFNTGPTRSAMNFPALVTGPGLDKINAERMTSFGNVGFRQSDERPEQLDIRISPEANGVGHRFHEL